MKKYTSKDLKEKHFFVLYDNNDNIMCCFASYAEFEHCFHYPLCEITRKFNNSITDYINLVVENKKYKLYTFC